MALLERDRNYEETTKKLTADVDRLRKEIQSLQAKHSESHSESVSQANPPESASRATLAASAALVVSTAVSAAAASSAAIRAASRRAISAAVSASAVNLSSSVLPPSPPYSRINFSRDRPVDHLTQAARAGAKPEVIRISVARSDFGTVYKLLNRLDLSGVKTFDFFSNFKSIRSIGSPSPLLTSEHRIGSQGAIDSELEEFYKSVTCTPIAGLTTPTELISDLFGNFPSSVEVPDLSMTLDTTYNLYELFSVRNLLHLTLLRERFPYRIAVEPHTLPYQPYNLRALPSLKTLTLRGFGADQQIGRAEIELISSNSLRSLVMSNCKLLSIKKIKCPELRMISVDGGDFFGPDIHPPRSRANGGPHRVSDGLYCWGNSGNDVGKLDYECHEDCVLQGYTDTYER